MCSISGKDIRKQAFYRKSPTWPTLLCTWHCLAWSREKQGIISPPHSDTHLEEIGYSCPFCQNDSNHYPYPRCIQMCNSTLANGQGFWMTGRPPTQHSPTSKRWKSPNQKKLFWFPHPQWFKHTLGNKSLKIDFQMKINNQSRAESADSPRVPKH